MVELFTYFGKLARLHPKCKIGFLKDYRVSYGLKIPIDSGGLCQFRLWRFETAFTQHRQPDSAAAKEQQLLH